MTVTTNQTQLIILTFLTSLLVSCSTQVQQQPEVNNTPLVSKISADCKVGFMRPPGAPRCLNIQELLDGKHRAKLHTGVCPKDWRRTSAKGYCLPKYQVIACGPSTFACGETLGDTFRITSEPPKCKGGSIVVLGSAPSFGSGGLYLGARVTYACGPFIPTKPV